MAKHLESSRVRLSPNQLGLARLAASPPASLEAANSLLQKNHDLYHMYFRDVAGHNHIPHSILTVLAMGGGPAQLQRAFDDGVPIQRPLPPLSPSIATSFRDPAKFRARMMSTEDYSNYLSFFEAEIETKGWEAVVQEHCFSRSANADYMLAQLFEGVFHPLIHLGFGVEFQLPSIVAEGLAQAASHYRGDLDVFFLGVEKLLQTKPVAPRRLLDLYHAARADEKIRTAARASDRAFRVRDGVLGRALPDITALAAQYQVTPDSLDLAMAEMLSCAAYVAATTVTKPGKRRRIDFYVMHNVTSAVALVVLLRRAPWLAVAEKVRLLEWKGRLDLVMYAAIACPELREENLLGYEATLSQGWDWEGLYRAVCGVRDDGHIAKFVRALRVGEEVERGLEGEGDGDWNARLPVKGDLWFRVAQLCFDTTSRSDGIEAEEKWVMGAGFEPMWAMVPDE
ncbi:hypothetical protein F4808DRAFT_443144 [Astrocystis sublimbata]|nr:hypothetical protein F4808DRAFT_443144 [Astrocystis sublimbata]